MIILLLFSPYLQIYIFYQAGHVLNYQIVSFIDLYMFYKFQRIYNILNNIFSNKKKDLFPTNFKGEPL